MEFRRDGVFFHHIRPDERKDCAIFRALNWFAKHVLEVILVMLLPLRFSPFLIVAPFAELCVGVVEKRIILSVRWLIEFHVHLIQVTELVKM